MQIYGKKGEKEIGKKSSAVLRFEPPTAYMWTMYDNHHAIEVIIYNVAFLVYLDMRLRVN